MTLPDCRAYELVTPPELGRTQDMTFENGLEHAVASSDGEHVALVANGAFVEPGASVLGTKAVFSRTPGGWAMRSAAAPGMAGEGFKMELLSPDLSQVAIFSAPELGLSAHFPAATFQVGPVGGPYTTLASVPNLGEGTDFTGFLGANAGTPGVPAFSDVVFASRDHALLPPGPERKLAEETEAEQFDLYEWTGGGLRLVNVDSEGRLVNRCGAWLGDRSKEAGNALNAVSADGSKLFFISPNPNAPPACLQPQLYMRVDGRETVEVSEPEGVRVEPSERALVAYDGASADGSKVFFTTATGLTPGAGTGFHLYEYDTEAEVGHRLTLIADGVSGIERQWINPYVVASEDGSTVYFLGAYEQGVGIFRYDTATREKSFVAVASETAEAAEPMYATADGGFLLFASGPGGVQVAGPHGLEPERRGFGHEELYRYDRADGSVVCVSCGEGVAPVKGTVLLPEAGKGMWSSPDSLRTAISVSEDGRRVFFQSSAQLVAQDTNESTVAEERSNAELGFGADGYEWEQDGTEEEPGVFCAVANGCTHLISAGEDVGPERFLGASRMAGTCSSRARRSSCRRRRPNSLTSTTRVWMVGLLCRPVRLNV